MRRALIVSQHVIMLLSKVVPFELTAKSIVRDCFHVFGFFFLLSL